MITHLFRILILLVGLTTLTAQTYLDSTATTTERVADLLSHMTLEEKIGQMTQAERWATEGSTVIRDLGLGSILSGGGSAPANNTPAGWADMYDDMQSQALQSRLGIPLIYGIDAVHGHSNVVGAVLFPHNIGLGATGNPELVKETQRITALEVSGTGIDWTFSPCIAVPRDERWGRTYEGFGETPDLNVLFGRAAVEGLQGDSLRDPKRIAACAKHYVGDGGTSFGRDQGNAEMTEAELRSIHLPGYEAAIAADVATIMASFNSWNGEKLHGHQYLLNDVLKNELGFEGFVISDWQGIQQLPGDYRQDVKQSILAGIDMVMEPSSFQDFITTLKDLVDTGEVPISRIDDAVSRILRIKFDLGLFERPYTNRALTDSIGIQRHRDVARQAVRESLVLLKKENGILPLDPSSGKLLVTGSHADNLGYQCGGWSISWQGSSGAITEGTTILEGLQQRSNGLQIIHDPQDAGRQDADVALVVIGEKPYAEGSGDDSDLHLDETDVGMIRSIKARGIPTIVLLLSGRPMIVDNLLHSADILIAGWLPGTEGEGISDILFGDFEPSGRLPHSWPRSMTQVPINWGDADYSPLYPYNHGILTTADRGSDAAMIFQSAELIAAGEELEIALDRPVDPASTHEGFHFFAGNTEIQISDISFPSSDDHNLVLGLVSPAPGDVEYAITYSQGGVRGTDGSILSDFTNGFVFDRGAEGAALKVPGRVEAESFVNAFGVQTEATTDIGGGLNVGWIDTGDWMDYNLKVETSGLYDLYLRVAALSQSGVAEISSGDTAHTILVDIPVTGGWQSWASIFTQIQLDKGEQTLNFYVREGGFNLNWMDFSLPLSNSGENQLPAALQLYPPYPNPSNEAVSIRYSLPNHGFVNIRIFDMLGREAAVLFAGEQGSGDQSLRWNTSSFSSGTYFIRVDFENSTYTEKCILLK